MIARAAAGPGRPVAYPYPTFPFYFTQGRIENARCLQVPCGEDFSLPLEALAKAKAAVTFVASPDSPTGATATPEQLEWLAGKLKGLLVIDEAYVDFADRNAAALADAAGQRDRAADAVEGLLAGGAAAGLRAGESAPDGRAGQDQGHLQRRPAARGRRGGGPWPTRTTTPAAWRSSVPSASGWCASWRAAALGSIPAVGTS